MLQHFIPIKINIWSLIFIRQTLWLGKLFITSKRVRFSAAFLKQEGSGLLKLKGDVISMHVIASPSTDRVLQTLRHLSNFVTSNGVVWVKLPMQVFWNIVPTVSWTSQAKQKPNESKSLGHLNSDVNSVERNAKVGLFWNYMRAKHNTVMTEAPTVIQK